MTTGVGSYKKLPDAPTAPSRTHLCPMPEPISASAINIFKRGKPLLTKFLRYGRSLIGRGVGLERDTREVCEEGGDGAHGETTG